MAAQVIPEPWEVPQRFRQRVGIYAGKQRAMVDSGHLLLILHDIPEPGDADRTARLFWRAPDGTWKASGTGGDGFAALKRHLENFQRVIHDLDEKVEKTQKADELYAVLRHATPLQRTTRNLHKALQDAREGIDDKSIITMRDFANDLERGVELVVTDAKNALEYAEAKQAEEQTKFAQKTADAQHRLNLLAALFFPVTAIGTMLGTNLHSGLEGRPPWVFWTLLVLSFGVGFFVRGSLK
jgi:hypothetical protein